MPDQTPELGAIAIGEHPVERDCLLLPFGREQMLWTLPKGGTVCEVGVAAGEFAFNIWEAQKPDHLILVDPWRFIPYPGWENDANRVTDEQNGERLAGIRAHFAEAIETGRVETRQGLSSDVLPHLPDASLDWIYIDGDHAYASVLEDLRLAWPKVKADGYIMGHDFAHEALGRALGFGVVEAVRDFVTETGAHFLARTHEPFSTFVLVKEANGQRAADLRRRFFAAAKLVAATLDGLQRG
ncbi:MAG: class I SAM-dependent methyltransferase [Rhodospirillales bacterium]